MHVLVSSAHHDARHRYEVVLLDELLLVDELHSIWILELRVTSKGVALERRPNSLGLGAVGVAFQLFGALSDRLNCLDSIWI